MKIEKGLNPNCSEAVFRFYTTKPKDIQFILQAFADEISATEGDNVPSWKNQKVPIYKKAEMYATKFDKKDNYYGNVILKDCAGLGDNEAVVTIEKDKKAFVLNIGNNSISENKTGWVQIIKGLGIRVIEPEDPKEGKELQDKYARDCCCGIEYGFIE
jgi:hypothetical protein